MDGKIGDDRDSLAFRLAVLIAVYSLTAIGLSLLLAEPMRRGGRNAVVGVQYSIGLILIPNIFAFSVTALLIKRTWANLGWRHCAGSALLLAPITLLLMFGLVLLLGLVFGNHIESLTAILAAMLLPGVLTAQLLRLAGEAGSGPVN